MASSQVPANSVGDFIQYMASYDKIQNSVVNIDSSSSEDDEIEIVKETTVTTTEKHRCDLCNEAEYLIDKLLKFGGLINEKFKFVCDKCDQNFERKSQLKEHSSKCQGLNYHRTAINNSSRRETPTNSHNGDASVLVENEPAMCKICFKIVKSKRGLSRHMTNQHSNVNHTCEVCKEVFGSFVQFRHHCAKHQMGNKNYACKICSKQFHSSNSLKKHAQKHNDS